MANNSLKALMSDKDVEEQLAIKKWLIENGIDPNSYTADQLDAMYTDYEGERGILTESQAQADVIRDTAGEGMGGTQAGDIFVADNPFEGVAKIGKEYIARKQTEKVKEGREALNEKSKMARAAQAKAMAAAIRGPQAPKGAQMATPTRFTEIPGGPPMGGPPMGGPPMGGGAQSPSGGAVPPPNAGGPLPTPQPVAPQQPQGGPPPGGPPQGGPPPDPMMVQQQQAAAIRRQRMTDEELRRQSMLQSFGSMK